jgi:CheY-like chemotaxis protein
MHLPDITGEEVLQKLAEHPVTRAIPVVVLSADASPQLPRRLQALGARAFLSKPLNVKQVLRVIDDVLAPRASS